MQLHIRHSHIFIACCRIAGIPARYAGLSDPRRASRRPERTDERDVTVAASAQQ
jgi:transglutaminase-like putative cysteine protease